MYIIRTVVIGSVETVEDGINITKTGYLLVRMVEENKKEKDGERRGAMRFSQFPHARLKGTCGRHSKSRKISLLERKEAVE
jgi:hypothetical protein